MDFPCSVSTSMFATIWRTKKVTLLRRNDKIMHLCYSLHQLSPLKLMTTFTFSIIISQITFNAGCCAGAGGERQIPTLFRNIPDKDVSF